ncbi:uncharacterized protein LOC119432382 isoform X1 [Dermacentor silvarum]|uniref:uncharacterized protein LOC119432382 isoform X1 n=1 Tax=Dermacentor silvarum TaxID=543639 RepID=UPI0021016928|nr:uncharacterized protein LOC119432382 isoform X1 [Dermacentor silvarum]
MVFALARSALESVKDAAAPLTDNVLTRTVAAAPGAVLGAAREYVVEPVTEAVVNLPSTAVAAPKLVLEAVKNTTTVISVGVKGTASALNPFGFVHKLTKGAAIGIGVAVRSDCFHHPALLLDCSVEMRQRNGRRVLAKLAVPNSAVQKGCPCTVLHHVPSSGAREVAGAQEAGTGHGEQVKA